jgi:hypothetical protein
MRALDRTTFYRVSVHYSTGSSLEPAVVLESFANSPIYFERAHATFSPNTDKWLALNAMIILLRPLEINTTSPQQQHRVTACCLPAEPVPELAMDVDNVMVCCRLPRLGP